MGYQNYNQALITPWLGDSRINEVKSQLGAVYGKDIDVLFIHETHAYLTHHNKGRYVKPCDVVAWIFENNPNELEDIIVPDDVVKKYLYHEDARDDICELFKNLWKRGLMVTLHDAWLAFSIGVAQYADNELRYTAIEHDNCIVTAWLVLNEKTFPLDPNSQDVIELCNNMHKHGVSLSVPTNANPMVWGGNKRLSQFANLTCVDDDSVESLVDDQDENAPNYNEVDGKVVNDIDSMMKNLSIQGCTPKQQEKYVSKYIKSFKSEASKRRRDRKKKEQEERVRLAAEVKAREEEEERERLAAEAREKEEENERERLVAEAKEKERERLVAEAKEKERERERLAAEVKKAKERERLAAEAKKVEEEARIALAAVEAKAKEERDRLTAEAKEKEERERLAVETKAKEERDRLASEAKEKECERLVVEATTGNDDPEFGDQDPFSDMEDNATLGGENSADDDAISISSAEYDDEVDEAEQLVEVDDEFESQLAQRFASAFNQFNKTLTTEFKPDDTTRAIAEEYQKNCKARGGCSFKENGSRISKLCTDIRHTGNLRKKKLVVGAGRSSPNSQRVASAGKQQIGCFVVCFDMLKENDFFGNKEVELYSQLLFGFGDDRYGPQMCLAFMELIKVVLSCDCDEIEVWFKSTLRVAMEDEDFLYFAGTLMSLDSNKKVTIRCMENGLLTYEMLKEISQAKRVREDKLKAINQVILHINASKNLSIVPDEHYDDNVKHHQLLESKVRQYLSQWRKNGLPDDVIKDLEVVKVGEGSYHTAIEWRERCREANEELKMLKPSQREYITASEDEGSAKVSLQAREFYVKPTTSEPRGKDKRPIAYLRTSKHDELNNTDFIECGGEKIPIDQFAWTYADIKLRGYTGKILIIVDNGSVKSNMCNKGMSLVLDSVQDSDFGAVFMTTPNRAFDDAVAFQMMLEAETIYPGLIFHCSQDTGKDRIEGARKVAERKIRRQVVIDEYNTTVSGVDQRLVRTLPEPHRQLNSRMKRAAVWKLTHNRLETVSSIQADLYDSVSPWIPKVLDLMKKRKRSIGGSNTTTQSSGNYVSQTSSGKWVAKYHQIGVKTHHIGTFDSEELARQAWDLVHEAAVNLPLNQQFPEWLQKQKLEWREESRSIGGSITEQRRIEREQNKRIKQEKKKKRSFDSGPAEEKEVQERNRLHAQATRNRKKQREEENERRVNELRYQQLSYVLAIAGNLMQDDNTAVVNPQIIELLKRRSLDDIRGIESISVVLPILPSTTVAERNRLSAKRSRDTRREKNKQVVEMKEKLERENALLLDHAKDRNIPVGELKEISSTRPAATDEEKAVDKDKTKKKRKSTDIAVSTSSTDESLVNTSDVSTLTITTKRRKTSKLSMKKCAIIDKRLEQEKIIRALAEKNRQAAMKKRGMQQRQQMEQLERVIISVVRPSKEVELGLGLGKRDDRMTVTSIAPGICDGSQLEIGMIIDSVNGSCPLSFKDALHTLQNAEGRINIVALRRFNCKL